MKKMKLGSTITLTRKAPPPTKLMPGLKKMKPAQSTTHMVLKGHKMVSKGVRK